MREVASSALRKATPPPEKSGGVAGDEQPGGTLRLRINADAKTAAAGATSHLGLMKASWRPVILQTYGERSVAWRCARSLALPLLILSLGAGTLVVLSPEMALTSIDQLLEDAHVRQVARDERKPSEGMVLTGASFDQPRRSTMLAEPSAQAMASSVGAPGGEAGPTQLPASSGGPSSSAISPPDTSTFKVHDTPEVAPVRVADDDHRQSPLTRSSPSPTKPLLDAGAAPAAAPSAQAEIVEASESPNVVIAARSDALPEAVASKAPRPARAVLATPKASISPPTATRSPTTDAAASPSFSGSSNGSGSGSIGDPVSEAPARIAADLATPQAPISVPKAIPSPAADAATSSSFAIESEVRIRILNGDAPASVLAALATPAAATSVPGPAPSPKPEEAALPSLAAQSFEPKSASNSDPVSEAPASVVAGLATPQASISLATVAPSSTPPAAAPLSGAPERVDSRANSTDDAVSQVPSSAMAGFTALQASTSLAPAAVSPRPDRAASSEPGENVASDELIPSRPRASGEIAFDAATPSAMQEAPASLPSTPAALPNTLAQASPASPI